MLTERKNNCQKKQYGYLCFYLFYRFTRCPSSQHHSPSMPKIHSILRLFTGSVRSTMGIICGRGSFHRFRIRHLSFISRANGFFTTRHQYYANTTTSFQQIRPLTSGDTSLNPVPITRSQLARLNCDANFRR